MFALIVLPTVEAIQRYGITSLRGNANTLNNGGVRRVRMGSYRVPYGACSSRRTEPRWGTRCPPCVTLPHAGVDHLVWYSADLTEGVRELARASYVRSRAPGLHHLR
jgi:hypothetical protein